MVFSPERRAAKSLELHEAAVAKIRESPQLFERVKATNERFARIVSANSQLYVRRWQMLIDTGMEACLAKAVEKGENARVMRKSSPFTGILSEHERLTILAKWAGTPFEEMKRQTAEALKRLDEAETCWAAECREKSKADAPERAQKPRNG